MALGYRDHLCIQVDEMLEVVATPMSLARIVTNIRGFEPRRLSRASQPAVAVALEHLRDACRVLVIHVPGRPPEWVSREGLRYLRMSRDYAEYEKKHGGRQ